MPPATARLYLLCFAYHRFRQINDNLIEAFIHLVDQYESQARAASEAVMQQSFLDAAENLKAAGQVLPLFTDASIAEDAPFSEVRTKAFSLLERERFAVVSDYMRNIAFDKVAYQWNYYAALSNTFKRNLRHLFSELEFAGRVEDAPLMEAVAFLQELLRQGKSPRQAAPALFPVAFMPKSRHRYLYLAREGKKKQLEVDRYEFLVYRQLRNALEAGDVFVHHSNEFRRFEDDLISDARWQDKDSVLCEIGSPILSMSAEDLLAILRTELQTALDNVNRRIADGNNQHIKIRGSKQKRRWKPLYPSVEEPVNSSFYGQIPGIGIADLLGFVSKETGSGWKRRSTRSMPVIRRSISV